MRAGITGTFTQFYVSSIVLGINCKGAWLVVGGVLYGVVPVISIGIREILHLLVWATSVVLVYQLRCRGNIGSRVLGG